MILLSLWWFEFIGVAISLLVLLDWSLEGLILVYLYDVIWTKITHGKLS